MAACVLALSGCQVSGEPSWVADPGGQRAVQATLPFTVMNELGAPVIYAGTSRRIIEADLGKTQLGNAMWVQPLADDQFALWNDRRLIVVSDGKASKSVDVTGCFDGVGAGDRVLMLCPGAWDAAATFTVRSFDAQLNEAPPVAFSRVHERIEVADREEGLDQPTFLAAGPGAFWVFYPDRKGAVRYGSRLIAKHDYSGRVLATVRVDGSIFNHEVSPDGRHVALLAGGSSGACHTEANLRVIDLDRMQQLNTGSDTPAAALAAATGSGDVYFTGIDLHWDASDTLVATGTTAHHNADCDVGIQGWKRTFRVGTPGLQDERMETMPELADPVGWVGPECGDVLVSAFPKTIRRQGGIETPVEGTILYAGVAPDRCRP